MDPDSDTAMSVRAFRPADREAVKALWSACGLVMSYNDPSADLDRAAGRSNSDVLVGTLADGTLVATIMVGHDGHRGWLYYVAVDPSRRGRGLGRTIVRAGEDWLRGRGVRKAQLLIRETNAAVQAFYEGVGWAAVPRVVMERWLVPPDS